MNIVPVYDTLKVQPTVTALLGAHPNLRVYEFGQAPADPVVPYVTWQEITGTPDNTLGCPPGYDMKSIQVDIYGKTAVSARAVKDAIVPPIESKMYITSWDGEGRDPPTTYYRITFSVDWFIKR